MKSNDNLLVSVIIPCYNDYKYINEAVKSINNQTHKNVEIIIIDDGSDIQTKKVLKKMEQKNLTVIYQENAGPSTARNNGIQRANGDYILTLDADDFYDVTFLSKGMKVFVEKSDIGLISSWSRVFNDRGIIETCKPEGGDVNTLIFNNGISGGSALFRKKCWSDVNGYDEMMVKGFEDWEFNISIVKAGWKIHIIEEALFNYRDKKNSRNKIAIKNYKRDLIKYMMLKHKDVFYNNFERMIDDFFDEKERLINRGINLKQSKEYKIGRFMLLPIRIVKRIIKKDNYL